MRIIFVNLYFLLRKIGSHLCHLLNFGSIKGIKSGRNTLLPYIHLIVSRKLLIKQKLVILIGDNCTVEKGLRIKYSGGFSETAPIQIGNHVFLGQDVEFNISDSIVIGQDCLIASGCKFIDHNHGIYPEQLMRLQPETQKAIVLEEDVWLGSAVIVLKGVTIKRGAVVASGAVVTKDIGTNEIWGGVPARQIGLRV